MKPEIPHLELDPIDIQEIKNLPVSQLENTMHDKIKWYCSIEGCNCYTTIKDFGISPEYNWRKRWINLSENIYYCAKHWKQFQQSGKDDSKFSYKPGSGLNHLQ